MRETIDKTAAFIAQHGLEFERRMMVEANAMERFGFLFAGHGYRGYYEKKLAEFREGKVNDVKPSVPEAVALVKAKEKQKEQLMLKNQEETGLDADPFADILRPEDYKEMTLLGFPSEQFTLENPGIAPMEE